MSLVTPVKASNITNLSDARYCAGMGVDWIGFPVREISPTQFTEITGWLSGPKWVLELNDQPWPSPSEYPAASWQCAFQDLARMESFPGTLLVSLDVQQWAHAESLRTYSHRVEAVIITGFTGNLEADRDTIVAISELFPVLVDVSAAPYPLSEIIRWPGVGINVHGTHEQRPGLKDYAQLAEVLEQLETD